jgi:hypothetical protein
LRVVRRFGVAGVSDAALRVVRRFGVAAGSTADDSAEASGADEAAAGAFERAVRVRVAFGAGASAPVSPVAARPRVAGRRRAATGVASSAGAADDAL